MAKLVLTNARLFVDGADLTSNTNKVEIKSDAVEVDVTNFGSGGWHEALQGLHTTKITGAGQWEANDPTKVDDANWNTYSNGTQPPWTLCPVGAADGALAYFTQTVETKYALGGEVGKVAPWSAEGSGTWPLVKGFVGHPAGVAETANGTGTGYNLGAAATGQYLYASLHVYSISGTGTPTVTVVVESATSNTFSTPTTRLSFTAATAVGGQVARTAGPITDTWYRARWTISGTTPSFLFVVALQVR
jgi:hypothetical protein